LNILNFKLKRGILNRITKTTENGGMQTISKGKS